ncbi:MAG: hypothetical protein KGL39_60365 [Patescibacteria group bacterium]|nr:hypothetical protein [Patescibacteria group bacterium]
MPDEATTELEAGTPAEGASTDASTQGQEGQGTDKTFTQAQLDQILTERLKGYQQYGKPEEIANRLARAEQLEKMASGMSQTLSGKAPSPAAELSEKDKEVLAYLNKLSPGFTDLAQEREQMRQMMQGVYEQSWRAVSEQNTNYLNEVAKKAGYSEEHLPELVQRVADSIRANPQDHQAYLQTGGRQIVDKHFAVIDKWLKSFGSQTSAKPGSADAALAKAKAATQKLPPRAAPGGIGATQRVPPQNLASREFVGQAFDAFSGKS